MLRHSCVPSRPAVMGTPWWCRWPTERHPKMVRPSTTISNRLASVELPPSMSRFLTMTFVDTRPPPSLHTCVRSNANPLAPKTPASAHAARWWPRQSRRWPHRQVREEKGRGSWRRRHNNTRKGCGSIRVDRDVGNATRTLLARGPLCDLHNARSGSVKLGHSATHASAPQDSHHLRAQGATQPRLPPVVAPQTVTPTTCSRIHAVSAT